MTGYALAGVLITALVVGIMRWNRRRSASAANAREVRQRRRDGIEEFIRGLSTVPPGTLSREQVHRRTARAAMRSVGAVTASLWEPAHDNHLEARIIEGLFPSQSETVIGLTRESTGRAGLIEKILRPAPLAFGEGLVGRVAATRIGEFNVGGANGSVIAAPILAGDQLLAVVAVARSSPGDPFTAKDLSTVSTLAAQVSPYLASV